MLWRCVIFPRFPSGLSGRFLRLFVNTYDVMLYLKPEIRVIFTIYLCNWEYFEYFLDFFKKVISISYRLWRKWYIKIPYYEKFSGYNVMERNIWNELKAFDPMVWTSPQRNKLRSSRGKYSIGCYLWIVSTASGSD